MQKTQGMLDLFLAARRVSVPLLVIRTADQSATAELIRQNAGNYAAVQWDAARGMGPMLAPNGSIVKESAKALTEAGVKPDETIGFVDAMLAAQRLPKGTVLIVFNAHRQLAASEPLAIAPSVQAVANLRDQLKRNFRMLVMLGPAFMVPSELEHDVVVIDHPLPARDELATLVDEVHAAGKLEKPAVVAREKAVDAVSGLSLFAAEQATAMSLTEDGIDLPGLWERKRVTIEQTRGLRVYRGTETFADIVGLESVKARFRQRLKAKVPIGVVVWLDSNRVPQAG